MTIQVNHLASVWFRGDPQSTTDLGETVDQKVDSYANGELDHAAEAMVLLWEFSREGPSPAHWQAECTPGPVTLTEVITVYPLILASAANPFCPP